ncbi:MAG: hypothetical protein ACOC5R_02785 [Elusimicrobiota bacterium]
MLNEEDNYINLISTFANNAHSEKKILREKINLTKKFISYYKYTGLDFAHIAHYGNTQDIEKEVGFIFSNNKKGNDYFNNSYPVVYEIEFKNFNTEKENRSIAGAIILISNTAAQLIKNKKLRNRKINQAAKLASTMNCKVIGMGGLIGSFTDGGKKLVNKYRNMYFTSGHSFTIANIREIARKILNKVGLDFLGLKVAIIGAAGSIGSGCAKLLLKEKIESLYLFDTTFFIAQKKLDELKNYLLQQRDDMDILTFTDLKNVKKADLVIVATNSIEPIVFTEHIKKDAIIIDDSYPKNVSKKLIKLRNDTFFLEGGATQLPENVNIYINRKMKPIKGSPIYRLTQNKQLYGCISEVIVLTLDNYNGNYYIGKADPVTAEKLYKKSQKWGIKPALVECYGGNISKRRIKVFKGASE